MALSGLDCLQCLNLGFECWGRWAWFHPFDLFGLIRCFIWISTISSSVVVVAICREVVISSQIRSSGPFRLARMSNKLPYSAELNQNLVGKRPLHPVTRSVYTLCSSLELLVCSICDHEPTLGLRPIQSTPCALLLGSSPRPSNNPRTSVRPSTQPSDRSLSAVC